MYFCPGGAGGGIKKSHLLCKLCMTHMIHCFLLLIYIHRTLAQNGVGIGLKPHFFAQFVHDTYHSVCNSCYFAYNLLPSGMVGWGLKSHICVLFVWYFVIFVKLKQQFDILVRGRGGGLM